MTHQETKEKYFTALKDMHLILEHTDNISITSFIKKYNLSKSSGVSLTRGGIIKNIGTRGKGAKYKWNTIKPNMHMAEEWLKRTNETGNKAMQKTRYQKQSKNKTKEFKKHKIIDYSVTKLFFGLIKIKTNYFYK